MNNLSSDRNHNTKTSLQLYYLCHKGASCTALRSNSKPWTCFKDTILYKIQIKPRLQGPLFISGRRVQTHVFPLNVIQTLVRFPAGQLSMQSHARVLADVWESILISVRAFVLCRCTSGSLHQTSEYSLVAAIGDSRHISNRSHDSDFLLGSHIEITNANYR